VSAKLIGEVFENAPKDITFDEMAVLIGLAEYAGDSLRFCFPKIATLAKKLHCGETKLKTHIHSLIEKGAIAVYDHKRHKWASVYCIQKFGAEHHWPDTVKWGPPKAMREEYERRELKPRATQAKRLEKIKKADAVVSINRSKTRTTYPIRRKA